MGRWYIRPLADGWWKILSPAKVQAAAPLPTEAQAFAAAFVMVGDEGGGELAVLADDEQPCCVHQVPPTSSPYCTAAAGSGEDEQRLAAAHIRCR
ncbi:hypothetical protein SAMN05421805_12813 [Saccharopolyspora antimicrobica]|uniref:Uncharacterized protein n=1 Tax=Saccharopolyspora antimicrobica TaxID=455193 RepID=A0A1I5KUA6_9PSEU|nr:DUF2188 domain-containing protein [Saccharopolyspora antimicrobica]RKT89134.1 hypothetical protein ATL45_7581 [Saccharopolyspora antimicrobica]SFO88206.1 hypothetical protein SAMN05421805_12813 [Saccharopolyspora antimicrobica]